MNHEYDKLKNELKTRMNEKSFKVSCLWPMAEDVCISFDGFPFFNLEPTIDIHSVHGLGIKGTISLTSEEARKLSNELLNAARLADNMERDLDLYHKQQEEANENC